MWTDGDERCGTWCSGRRSRRRPDSEATCCIHATQSSVWVDGEFLRGPIPLAWLGPVCCLPGQKVLAVSLAIWFLRGLRKSTDDLTLTDATVARFGVKDRSAKYRALEA